MSAKIVIDVVANTTAANAALKKTQGELINTGKAGKAVDDSLGRGLQNATKVASTSLAELTDRLKYFKDQAFGEKDLKKLAEYNKGIIATQKEIKTLEAVGTGSFGALGSGATKAFSVLRTAANILPGIGIAGLLAFATGPVIEWASSIFDASKATKELQKEQANLKKTTDGIFENAGKEAAEVGTLIAVLKSETETRERKLRALQELKKINPDIFSGLQLEKGAVSGLDAAYQTYLDNLKLVIAAKIKQAQLEVAITKLLELQGVTQTRAVKGILDLSRKFNEENARIAKGAGIQDQANAALQLQRNLDKINADKIAEAQGAVNDLIKDIQELSGGVKLDPLDKIKKAAETIPDVLAELSREIDFLNAKSLLPEFGEQDKEKVSKILSTVEKLIKDFRVAPDDTLISKLLGGGLLGNLGSNIPANIPGVAGIKNRYVEAVKVAVTPTTPITITTPIKPGIVITSESLKKLKETVIADFSSVASEIGIGIGNSLGETIGDAISGSGGLDNIFKGIFKVLGEGLKDLGKYLIQLGVKFIIAKQALDKIRINPYLAIAAGIALVALGQVAQNSFKNRKAFASGGLIRGPGTGTSDSIPILASNGEFVLRQSAVAALGPDNLSLLNQGKLPQSTSISAGVMQMSGTLVGKVAGEDIYISLSRYEARRGRAT